MRRSIEYNRENVSGEPSPEMVDLIVSRHRGKNIEVSVAIGEGSVIDAGKAVSAMLLQNCLTREFLEGIGTSKHHGIKVPFIPVPTTAGTGSDIEHRIEVYISCRRANERF